MKKLKSFEEKEIYYNRLSKFIDKKDMVKFYEIENYKYFQNPIHSIIRTMISREDFKEDPNWIKNKLKIKETKKEIKEAIKRLKDLQAVEYKNGKLVKTHKHIKNISDVPSDAVKIYHQKMSLIAANEIFKQSMSDREFNSFCLNIKQEHIKKAKLKIRNFISEFISDFEATDELPSNTYQINIQLFSLTN